MNKFEFNAGQAFVTEVKNYWHTKLFRSLDDEYQKLEKTAHPKPQSTKDVESLLKSNTTYQVFAWVERNLQRMKYSGRYGLVNWYGDKAGELSQAPSMGELHLDAELEMPKYYVNCDIHQHPGGVWSREESGLIYQHAAQTTTPLDGAKHADLHSKFIDQVRSRFPHAKRILEMACGFGKTTSPLREAYPDAEIIAVDLSGPCLKVAANSINGVKFMQMDAADTNFEDHSFDLIVSSMFLHEMPPPYIKKMLDECNRLLANEGGMVHLDFYVFPSLFRRFMHYSHGSRNNEPFMEPLAEMDLNEEMATRQFTATELVPFEEEPGVAAANYEKWRYPWTLIAAKKAA